MKIDSTHSLIIICACAVLVTGCAAKPAEDTAAKATVYAASESTEAKIPELKTMFHTQSAAIDGLTADWENSRGKAAILKLFSTFYYETLYDSMSGIVQYLQDKEGAISDLVIQMTVHRRNVEALDGGTDENLIYEWHSRDGLEYISVRSSTDAELLREFMCRQHSLSVDYLPDFRDTESEILWEQLFAELSDSDPQIEFIKTDGHYYKLDREEETFLPLPDSNENLFFLWLSDVSKQCDLAAKKSEITPKVVADALPKEYLLGFLDEGQYYNYDIADMNQDGYDDILVEIRPVNPAVSPDERSMNSIDSPYRKTDAYYALQLWLLEGGEDGGYTPRLLQDDIVWDDTYSFGLDGAFHGGFSIEYFVGRSPFSAYNFIYEFDAASDCFRQSRSYYTYSYDNVLTGRCSIGDEKNFGQISLPASFSDTKKESLTNWEDMANEIETVHSLDNCSIYNIPLFADRGQSEAVENLVREDLDRIVSALVTLGQEEALSLTVQCAFSNTNILVVSYEVTGYAAAPAGEGSRFERKLYRMYDLKTNERIPIGEAVSFEELKQLAELAGMPVDSLKKQYEHLEDPIYELGIENNPLSVFLTQEGLCLLTCDYQSSLRLVPREYLLDMEISSRWDDIPVCPEAVR